KPAATGVWKLPFIEAASIPQERPFPQDLPWAEVLVAEPATKDSDILPYSPDQLQAGSGTSFDFSGYPKPILGPSNELEAEHGFFVDNREIKVTVKFPQLTIKGKDVLFKDHVVGGLNYASHNHPDN